MTGHCINYWNMITAINSVVNLVKQEFVQSFKDRSKHLKASRLAKLTLSDSREERRVAKKVCCFIV